MKTITKTGTDKQLRIFTKKITLKKNLIFLWTNKTKINNCNYN